MMTKAWVIFADDSPPVAVNPVRAVLYSIDIYVARDSFSDFHSTQISDHEGEGAYEMVGTAEGGQEVTSTGDM